jgi:hypothetical protein
MISECERKFLISLNAFEARNECLWKISSKDCMDRNAKNDAWEQVAKTVGCDVRSAENKMKILKMQFFRYYKETSKKTQVLVQKVFSSQSGLHMMLSSF